MDTRIEAGPLTPADSGVKVLQSRSPILLLEVSAPLGISTYVSCSSISELDLRPDAFEDTIRVCRNVLHCREIMKRLTVCFALALSLSLGSTACSSQGNSSRGCEPYCVKDFACGYKHACAVLEDGSVWCWGDNFKWQAGAALPTGSPSLPDDNFPTIVQLEPHKVPGLPPAVSVAAGNDFSCARTAIGTVWCWGGNDTGQLGRAGTVDTLPHPEPAVVANVANATQVAAAGLVSCALLGDGTVDCWGNNNYGQLGIGTQDADPHSKPEAVTQLNSIKQITVSGMAPCALGSDGHVWCWGNNSYDQLGSTLPAGQTLSAAPLEVAGVSDGASISGGCVVTVSGTLVCWGFNTSGQIGLGDDANPVPYVAAPTEVPNLVGIAAVTTGGSFNCVLNKSGHVFCAGGNDSGELGQGTATPDGIRSFVAIKALSNIIQIEAGDLSTCALNESGVLFCWGMNAWGQLGRGNVETPPTYPATIEPVKWQ